MLRRIRFVRVMKWAGTLACLLILAVFAISARFLLIVRPSRAVELSITDGRVTIYYEFNEDQRKFNPIFAWKKDVEWMPHPLRLQWYAPSQQGSSTGGWLYLPLWLPFLIAVAPTLLLWRLDRSVPPGHCRKCRYNLAGNTSGRCPECGAVFAPAAR